MSESIENQEVKRWTAKRKASLVVEVLQGKISINQAARQYDLQPSELESWVSEAQRGMENALRAKPKDIREQYEGELHELKAAYGEAMLENKALKKLQALLSEIESSS